MESVARHEIQVLERELRSPDDVACAILQTGPDGPRFSVAIRPGLSQTDRILFELAADWAMRVIRRLIEHGAEPDGWVHGEVLGGLPAWHLWADLTPLPPLG